MNARFKTASKKTTARCRSTAAPEDFTAGRTLRRVMADDFTWFPITLVAAGNHMAAWVGGYPVSDWTDKRAPSENPRQGLRLEAGTLAIQGHDATTDLSFRHLQAAELPER